MPSLPQEELLTPAIRKLLGNIPDNEISRQTGVRQELISRWRRGLGIPISKESFERFNGHQAHRALGTTNELIAERAAYIAENWQHLSDEEMAENWGISALYIAKIRVGLGLRRRNSKPYQEIPVPQGIKPRLIKASSKAGQKRE